MFLHTVKISKGKKVANYSHSLVPNIYIPSQNNKDQDLSPDELYIKAIFSIFFQGLKKKSLISLLAKKEEFVQVSSLEMNIKLLKRTAIKFVFKNLS